MPAGAVSNCCADLFTDDSAGFLIVFIGAALCRGGGETIGGSVADLTMVAKRAGGAVFVEWSGLTAGADVRSGTETVIRRTAACSSREMRTASRSESIASASCDSMPHIL